MCQKTHTKWSCKHKTIFLTQCNTATRSCSCLGLLFWRRCPATTNVRTPSQPRRCPECRERYEATNRRSVNLEARRAEMAASYKAHKAGGRHKVVAPGQVPVQAPEPVVVSNGIRRGPSPPLSSSRDRPQVSREAYWETTASEGKQAAPKREEPSEEGGRPSPRRRVFSDGQRRRVPANPGRAPEEWFPVSFR